MNVCSLRVMIATGLVCGVLSVGFGGNGAALAQGLGSGGPGSSLTGMPPVRGLNAMNSSGLGQRTVRPHAGGLPGAQVNEENVAPADRAASDMGPTEALFDAVDRGDAVAARGAINRGADMRARSVFGFTPVELAVDLGRKDIAFLLLSMRGMDGRAELQPNRQTAAPNAAQQARQAVARVAPTTGPMAPHGPRLFAGDGGAAQPEVGFLGFGGGVDGGARPRAR